MKKTLFIFLFFLSPIAISASPGWLVKCYAVHSLNDDPIVFPNQSNASHLHDFIGNDDTNANSTYDSMLSGASNCGLVEDTGGYWTPSLYKSGIKIDPERLQVYYRKFYTQPVVAWPADFRMIAGNAGAASVTENPYLGREIYWGCSDNSTKKLTAPTNCSTGKITLHVGFPGCWDGVNLDSPNHKDHVAYPSSGVCPTTHPVRIPRLILRWEYAVGTDSSSVTLASGETYTAHGDFWNTWDQSKLEELVDSCLNANVSCGTFK